MKKIFILNYKWNKKVFFILNNLKKYLKENIFLDMKLSWKEIKEQISEITFINSKNGDYIQFNYNFKNLKNYSLNEYWIIS